jgi:hypothetical protein
VKPAVYLYTGDDLGQPNQLLRRVLPVANRHSCFGDSELEKIVKPVSGYFLASLFHDVPNIPPGLKETNQNGLLEKYLLPLNQIAM